MPRTFRNRDSKSEFSCTPCCYSTDKKSNFDRHCNSSRHKDLINVHEPQLSCRPSDSDITSQQLSLSSSDHVEDQNIDQHIESDEYYEPLNTSNYDPADVSSSESEFDVDSGKKQTSRAKWSPYESKIHFLLTVLHSSKTHKVSDELLSFIIFILKECGVRDVPSMSKVKSFWKEEMNIDDMIQRNEDENGNIHWMMKPETILKLSVSNPDTSKSIERYPIRSSNSGNSQHAQSSAAKWNEMDFSWGRNGTDNFFSGEFVLFSREGKECVGKINNFNLDGQENSLHAEVSLCEKGYGGESPELFIDADQQFIIDLNDRVNVSLEICSPLPLSRESLQKIHLMKKMTDKDGRESIIMMNENEREHFYKRKTQTLPVVKVPLNLFIDDLSVTKSRRWSPIHGVQAQLSGLPLSEKNKGKNTHFLSASDTVTMMDLLQPICSNIQHCKENGIKCFDALMKEEVLVTSDISLIVSDYQMMSLACNHLGPSANKFCPNCYVDHSNPFCVAEMRTVEKTTKTLDLLKLRSNTTGRQQDTPIGILHFLYLGLARHLVQLCVKNIPSNKVQTLETHLSSIDQSGFSYHINGNTFFKYLDSRQGKDFKHYLQIAPHNMAFVNVNKEYVTALEKLSLISKHIQQSKSDIEKEFIEYIEYVERNIPELGKKNKTHFCLHIGDDIHRHGSPLHYAEDQFEKNHGPIRNSFHHQNGHARSRDTVLQFTKCELTQHIVTGGYFMRDDEWQCAEKEVISYGRSKKNLSYLGMMEEEEAEKGEVKNAMRSNNRKILNVANALDEVYLLRLSILANISQSKIKAIYSYTSLTAERGELINTGSFVLYYQDSKNHIGVLERIFDIATRDRQTISVAFLRKARSVPDCQDGHQRVEVTSDTDHIRTSDILHPVHTIHDCRRGNCRIVEKRRTKRMEQENTTTTEVYLEHNDQYKTYILNKFRLDSLPEKLCFC